MAQGKGAKRSGGETPAQSAVRYIEAHYAEKFSLRTMSAELFVNGSYLLRVFKKHMGVTPLAYHNRLRCEKAAKLLADTDRSISETGETVGFVSSAHFSHVFKKETGMTPSEYRLRFRKERAEGEGGAAEETEEKERI